MDTLKVAPQWVRKLRIDPNEPIGLLREKANKLGNDCNTIQNSYSREKIGLCIYETSSVSDEKIWVFLNNKGDQSKIQRIDYINTWDGWYKPTTKNLYKRHFWS